MLLGTLKLLSLFILQCIIAMFYLTINILVMFTQTIFYNV